MRALRFRILLLILLMISLAVLPALPASAWTLVGSEAPGRIEYAHFPNQRTHAARPAIGAVVQWPGEATLSEARLVVDGTQVARWTSGSAFIWRPPQALDPGRHEAMLEVTLAGYTPLQLAWSFEQAEPPARPAVARDATADTLGALNRFRAAAGLPPASAADGLAQAAVHHAAYLAANSGTSGLDAHRQQPSRRGFTGTTVGDRAYAFGWAGFRPNEGVVLSTRTLEPVAAFETLIDTVYHRLPFQVAGATALGAGLSGGRYVVMVGQPADSSGSGGVVALSAVHVNVYPADGQVGVPIAWDGRETPDPYRLFPGARPGGYPITAVLGCDRVFHCYDEVTVLSARLFREGGVGAGGGGDGSGGTGSSAGGTGSGAGAPVPVRLLTPDNDPFLRTPPAVALLPVDALRPGTRYTAELSLRVRPHGAPAVTVERRWSFTTRSDEDEYPVAAAPVRIEIDGRPLATAVPPIIAAGRVLAPFRALAEALGADVAWDETAHRVTITRRSER
ncbi:MAG TPA: stalk domain-containing protein, partial [Bacillota bacterium]